MVLRTLRSIINLRRIVLIAVPILIIILLIQFFKPALKDGLSFSQAVYDRNHNLLRLTLSRDDKYRLWLPLNAVSPVLIRATLLHEDRLFLFHHGVEPASLVRSVWHTYFKRDRRMGGSTITMQLARIRFGINSRKISGKMKQILAAISLELFYSKKEILEAYLNLVPYGLNVEGVGAASLVYFHKNADRLTLPEALTLSVIPQSPARRIPSYLEFHNRKENPPQSPFSKGGAMNNPPLAKGGEGGFERKFSSTDLQTARAALFSKWAVINPRDRDQKPLMDIPVVLQSPADMPFLAPHFSNTVLQAYPYDSRIYTPLDLKLQKLIERHARAYIESKRHMGITNTAVLLVDHRSLEVKALLGSVDFFDPGIQGQVNGTSAKRSPGSAIKPFIYALGIDQGIIHPLTMLKDAPMSFGSYNPENFDGEFIGPLAAKDALIKSRNIPAVDIASKLTEPGLHRFFMKAGITRMREESFYGMSLALGSAELTMEELAKLYAMIANGGVLKPLRILRSQPVEEETRLLSREASFLVLDMLAANPRPFQGYRSDWTRDSLPVSWKTGTSFGFRDAWSVGVFGPYVLVVWIGNFDGEGNPAFIGREAAGPLLFEIIDSLRSQDPELRQYHGTGLADLNLAKVDVCAVSGRIPGPSCQQTVSTWFIPGKSPIAACDIHRTIFIDSRTGLRSCIDAAPGTRPAVYEFWPSDMLSIFKQAGIPRKVPPPYNQACLAEGKGGKGIGPQITSPQQGVTYSLRASSLDSEKIPFLAVTDADAREVYWFVNEKFLGRSPSGKPFFWKPRPGRFIVRAVDDQGRADSREIKTMLVE